MPAMMAGVTGTVVMAWRRESLANEEDISEPFKRLVMSLAIAPTVVSTTEVTWRPPIA